VVLPEHWRTIIDEGQQPSPAASWHESTDAYAASNPSAYGDPLATLDEKPGRLPR
jgi:hypothetical protein